MLLQRQKLTICLTIQLKEELRRQQVTLVQLIMKQYTYEGYGPNGIAIIVDALNRQQKQNSS